MSTLRVAAAQFHVNADLDGNLERSLKAVDEAAAGGARLVVLPEFCNHLSWYQDKNPQPRPGVLTVQLIPGPEPGWVKDLP